MNELLLHPDKTKIGLTVGNLIAICGLVSAAVIAWHKIPSSDDVRDITKASIAQATAAAEQRTDEFDKRLDRVEQQTANTNRELSKLNKRMDYMLIILAGSAADDMQRSQRARNAAEQVRKNLKAGDDPLEGLQWGE